MRLLTLLSTILVVGAGLGLAPALDAQSPGDSRQVEAPEVERWRDLPPETRQKIRKWAKTLRQLPEDRRRALLQRVRTMKPDELREFGQRMRQFQKKPKRERQKLSRRARMLRHIERTLTSEERTELRRLAPEERQRRVQVHTRRLMKRFQRALTHRQRDQLRRADRSDRRERFLEYLESTRAESGGRARAERSAARRNASTLRVRRLRAELEKLPPEVRRELLRHAESSEARVPARVRAELRALTPRERSQLRRAEWRGRDAQPRGRRGRGEAERRSPLRPRK
ncbi:MAG: hypothetical protein AAF488_04300 [Planctomycetota bacterium]